MACAESIGTDLIGEETRALLVGVSDYSGSGLDDLPSSALDVVELGLALETHRDGISENFGVTSRLVDSASRNWGAHDLLNDVDELIEDCEHFLFYFSGHGIPTNFGLQLATPEKNQQNDSGVYFDSLLHRFNAARAEVTVVLDCCFSGLAGDHAFGDANKALKLTHLRDGVTILASSGRNEKSMADEGVPSAFTREVISCLGDDEHESVDVIDLYDYTRRRLIDQRPVLRTFGSRFSAIRAQDLKTARALRL